MSAKAKRVRLDIIGNVSASEQRAFSSELKRSRKRLSYCSVLAAASTIVASNLQAPRSAEAKKHSPNVGELIAKPVKVKLPLSDRGFLKRLSGFRLPHENAGLLTTSGGNDDCPGKLIPQGSYTFASPYTDSGDTTGANDTISRLYNSYYYYYQYGWDALGPDHIYSFTLTARGAIPLIRVVRSSGTYSPMIYVLRGDSNRGCPVGTGNQIDQPLIIADSRGQGIEATLNVPQLNSLPLNVPLLLFVDSAANDAFGSGGYRLHMQDVTIGPAVSCSNPNPVDCSEFFVRQHYLDFLEREPETGGLAAWLSVLNDCSVNDLNCRHEQRLTTSAAFFGSPEFQLKGYFVFRFYRTAFARLPDFNEISADMQSVSGQTPSDVYSRKATFTTNFSQRQEFVTLFNPLPNAEYVSALLSRYGVSTINTVDPSQPDGTTKITLTHSQLVSRLDAGTLTRAQVLRAVADSDQVFRAEFNSAFVAMQYYGYLRRTPESTGYNSWLNYLNTHPGDFREMVRGFVDSIEYRRRFGQP